MARRKQGRSRSQTRQPQQHTPKRQNVFYAYPSEPPDLGETITAAIEELKADPQVKGTGLRFRPWPTLPVSGVRLLSQITSSIDSSDVFACDVTHLNANVAFEFGYAIGKFKRIWISMNGSIQNAASNYKRFYTGMLGAGYSTYENHGTLATSFLEDRPWRTLEQHLLGETYRNRAPLSEDPTLLYVKPRYDSDSVLAVRERISESVFARSPILDDPRENDGATLEWYADKISEADVVLIHLLADNNEGSSAHNAKASFVAGLAHGMDKQLLMLAHMPFTCPTDYQMLLQRHETSHQCLMRFDSWVDSFKPSRRRARRPVGAGTQATSSLQLRNLSLGEPVAENERSRLDGYFVETSAFNEALNSDSSILVGRRGTGKTATFVALNEALRRDRNSHVCTVQPVGYEVDGLIRLLSEDWRTAERGFLIESLWKFLLYTELAASILESTAKQPAHQQRTEDEEQLVQYIQSNSDILLAPFSQRLNRAVGALTGTGELNDSEHQRARISEHLHISHLG